MLKYKYSINKGAVGMISIVIQKLKKFRMSIPSIVLLVLASYRMLTSGESIQLVGVCAAIVPFICQFKNFPKADGEISKIQDVMSSYILNLVLMSIYLAWMLLLSWIGQRYIPSYITNPYLKEMVFIATAADVTFISAIIPICHDLKPMQRLIPGLVITNGLLIFMLMATSFVKTTTLTNIPVLSLGFCANIMLLTVGLIVICCRETNK